MITYHNCMLCEFFDGEIDTPTCEAFPQGIPVSIWNDEKKHDKPIEGDHGIQYQDNPKFLKVEA